jgi:hypothetical protein
MKLVGTRIRVETSEHNTEYFPEYCLEEKSLFGKTKEVWCGVSQDSTHMFGEACRYVNRSYLRYTEDWAKGIVDVQAMYWEEKNKGQLHEESKQTTYLKYP